MDTITVGFEALSTDFIRGHKRYARHFDGGAIRETHEGNRVDHDIGPALRAHRVARDDAKI